ncbi:MerR family transcriptional regulator [Rhizobium sp.]
MEARSIKDAARESGVKVPTIRYYEQIGLLPSPRRDGSNRRVFLADDLQRLAFIRHARDIGFEIDAIRTLLDLQDKPNQPCATADAIAQARLSEVNQRISSLLALKTELESMVEGCKHGYVSECRVIEVLTDHAKCLHERH